MAVAEQFEGRKVVISVENKSLRCREICRSFNKTINESSTKMVRKFCVGGNWKMNGNKKEINDIVAFLKAGPLDPNVGKLKQSHFCYQNSFCCESSRYSRRGKFKISKEFFFVCKKCFNAKFEITKEIFFIVVFVYNFSFWREIQI